MRNGKRLVAGLMATLMVLVLAGCSGLPFGKKAPTAKELLEGVNAIDAEKYNDMTMSMDVDMDAEGQKVGISLETGVEMGNDIMHMYDAKMSMSMEGLNFDISMEGWMDMKSDVSYMNMSALGQESGWTKSSMSSSDGDGNPMDSFQEMAGKFTNVDADKLEPVLAEHEKGEDYVVTWSADSGDIDDMMNEMMSSFGADGADVKLDKVDVTATFAEDTRELKSVEAKATATTDEGVCTVTFDMEFKTVNGDKDLSIPDDVVTSAIEEDGGNLDPDFGFGGDDGGTTGTVSGDGRYENDNAGYDEVVDDVAAQILINDPDYISVDVDHYDGLARVYYSTMSESEGWNGSLELCHVSDANLSWTTVEEEFKDQYDFLVDWYEREPDDGSLEDGILMFMDNDDGTWELDFAMYDDDLDIYVECEVYAPGSVSAEDVMGYLTQMIAYADMAS